MKSEEGDDRAEATASIHHVRGLYEIRVKGRLDDRWSAWFDGLTVERIVDGTTVLRGPIADQAALHGLLQRVRDLGLELISVARLTPN